VAGLGTFGSFTSTTDASQAVSSGEVKLSLTQHDSLGTTVQANGLVPGDTVQRAFPLTRSNATEKLGTVSLTTDAYKDNQLWNDATNGLKLTMDQCSVPWTKGTGNTLTCTGTGANNTPVLNLNGGAVKVATLPLADVTSTLNARAASSYLRVTLSLPSDAGNEFQGLSNTIKFTCDATQRAGEAR